MLHHPRKPSPQPRSHARAFPCPPLPPRHSTRICAYTWFRARSCENNLLCPRTQNKATTGHVSTLKDTLRSPETMSEWLVVRLHNLACHTLLARSKIACTQSSSLKPSRFFAQFSVLKRSDKEKKTPTEVNVCSTPLFSRGRLNRSELTWII